jgi:transposase-like protein
MSVQQKRKYDSDFKRTAVLLSEESGRRVPEVIENLGLKKRASLSVATAITERSDLTDCPLI